MIDDEQQNLLVYKLLNWISYDTTNCKVVTALQNSETIIKDHSFGVNTLHTHVILFLSAIEIIKES